MRKNFYGFHNFTQKSYKFATTSIIKLRFDCYIVYSASVVLLFVFLQHYASRHGHVKVCQTLLFAGADPNAQTPGGVTPLHRAAYAGHSEVVRLLLEYHANVLLCDDDGSTALHKV